MRNEKLDGLVLILTSGSPATNPRMVKEATELACRGFRVHVLYGFVVPWATAIDRKILETANWTAESVGGDPNGNIINYFFYRLIDLLADIFQRRGIFQFCLSRHSLPLFLKARKFKPRAIIAHNLAALPPAYLTAQRNGVPLYFDAEDFHSGESNNSRLNRIARKAEAKFFPCCDSISSASPLIMAEYQNIFPNLKFALVNNCFLIKDQQPFLDLPTNQLNIVWFSQTIGNDRGLNEFIVAVSEMNLLMPIHLTLIGACQIEFQTEISLLSGNSSLFRIEVLSPMTETEIMAVLRKSHIGLALEKKIPQNRNICLTNKIFSYLHNGCQIIFSDTKAQIQFVDQYPTTGRVVDLNDSGSIQRELTWFIENIGGMNAMRRDNWELANQKLHYENDAKKWLDLISTTLV